MSANFSVKGLRPIGDKEGVSKPKNITNYINIANDGADPKHGIEISIYDKVGLIGHFGLEGDFPVGTRKKYNLSTLGKQVNRIDLMFRGNDGIGRYLQHLDASSGKYFSSITCWWVTDPSVDTTIEQSFFSGTEAFILNA